MGRMSDAKMGADYVRLLNGWGKLQTASEEVLRRPIPTPPERVPTPAQKGQGREETEAGGEHTLRALLGTAASDRCSSTRGRRELSSTRSLAKPSEAVNVN